LTQYHITPQLPTPTQTNCLSEVLFAHALSQAKALDAHRRTSGPKGPLHGLPVSLKDNLHVAGADGTIGFVSLAFDPAAEESPLVGILRALGAVVYCKTNVPTAMMMAETLNNLTGRTVSPRDRRLTPGGSSGGEAALISFGGSVLGVGSDIGTLHTPF
jgi:amidase